MLKALYDYALAHRLTPPPGYAPKTVKAWVEVSTKSDYVGVVPGDGEEILCPDIGSLANGTTKSNVLTEKRSVIFPTENAQKTEFFLQTMRGAAEGDPVWYRCLETLEDPEKRKQVLEELDRNKVKPGDRISFRIDGEPGVSRKETVSWWQVYRKQFTGGGGTPETLCMITGEPAVPISTTPPIQGLYAVGGHARGDALISFDKPAFTSYGLKQAANAPVSEEAYAAVKAALDDLLKDAPSVITQKTVKPNHAVVLAGMKCVHWYDRDLPQEEDLIGTALLSWDDDEEDAEETALPVNEAEERRRADSVPLSVRSGVESGNLDGVRYYILLLTGVGGRVMVRRYEQGNYAELRKHIRQWYEDLALTNPAGTGKSKDRKLTARLMRLMKRQKVDKEPFRRMEKELAGVTPMVIESILNGTPLPDSVASRALAFVRSKMLESEDAQDSRQQRAARIPDGIACQWLKVWLSRNAESEKGDEKLMSEYNPNHPNTAYQCGAVMAILAEIQNAAMPDVGAGVVQRYYASAMQTPALVLGQLSKLSNYHLDKFDNKNVAEKYREKLAEAWARVGDEVPAVLNLEQQSYFTLGYYQMTALLNRKKKNENNAQNAEEAE